MSNNATPPVGRTTHRGAAVLVVVAATALLIGASLRPAMPPAVIAAVDLERLFNSLEEQAAADLALQRMADEMNVDVERRRREIDELRDEQESFQAGSASYRDLGRKIELAALELRAMVEFNRQKIEARRADFIRGLYLRIRDAVKLISQRDGINAVFLDDTIPALDRGDPNMVLQQISARRMIYFDKTFDITDEVISYMNSQHNAAGPAR